MSTISTIHDAIDTLLSTTFGATHTELVNPYEVDENDRFALNRGYSFYLGPAVNTERQLGCNLSIEREVVISLTIVNRGTDRDTTIRKTAEKQLLEDQMTLITTLEQDPTLVSATSKLVFASDNGLEFVFDDRNNYIRIESSFTMEYFEAY